MRLRTLVAVTALALTVALGLGGTAAAAEHPDRPDGPPPAAGPAADPCERVTHALERAHDGLEHANERLAHLQERRADAVADGNDELVERLDHRIEQVSERIEHLTELIERLTARQTEVCAADAA